MAYVSYTYLSENRDLLEKACAEVLGKWRKYTDESVEIYAETDNMPHNTITPIARMKDSKYECDLVLRNNRTTKERPLGIFHPNSALHHIKKENIGLIEVMGLAVLPARLAEELEILKNAMLSQSDLYKIEKIASHADWGNWILENHPEFNNDNAENIIRNEVGRVFEEVLRDSGVDDAAKTIDLVDVSKKAAASVAAAIQDPEQYLKDNREMFERYKEVKASDAYKNTPGYRLQELFAQLNRENGYNDVFIPAMRRLSSSYREYYEKLLKANEVFLKSYRGVRF